MFRKRRVNSNPGERIVFKTKPRFIVHSTSVVLKLIIIILILYFFRLIMQWTVTIKNYLVNWVQVPLVDWITMILFILILVLFLWIILDYLSWRQKKYILTNQRVIVQGGLIRRKKSFIHYNKIQDIIVSQSLVDRLFSAGNMEIFGGHEGTNLILEDIPNPLEVEDMINRLIEGEEVGFSRQEKSPQQKSIMEEYDKKFKR
ncbi:MAG TPA: PH domain-containing protein [Methanobacteriaceae archaeon]|nr:PH domain-containing protein [Methanobacteriaceae archaeon]